MGQAKVLQFFLQLGFVASAQISLLRERLLHLSS